MDVFRSFIWLGRGLLFFFLLAVGACQKAEESSGPPSTDEQAAQVIDLTKFPLGQGAPDRPARSLATLTYELSQGSVKTVFNAQSEKLKEQGWKENAAESSITDQAATGTFRKHGFVITLSVFSAAPPKLTVSLINHGNINYDRLPRPAGLKPVYVGAVSAMYVTDAAVAETTQAVGKLLADSGWQPYGQAGDTTWFKQNAVRLTATVSTAPAQGNKTMLSYSSELMSADLPLPEGAEDVRYADATTELTFETTAGKDAIVAFYKKALGAKQWQSTLEKLVDISERPTMIFRNPGKDLLTLSFSQERDGHTPVSLQFMSSAEVAEMDLRIKAKGDALRAQKR